MWGREFSCIWIKCTFWAGKYYYLPNASDAIISATTKEALSALKSSWVLEMTFESTWVEPELLYPIIFAVRALFPPNCHDHFLWSWLLQGPAFYKVGGLRNLSPFDHDILLAFSRAKSEKGTQNTEKLVNASKIIQSSPSPLWGGLVNHHKIHLLRRDW